MSDEREPDRDLTVQETALLQLVMSLRAEQPAAHESLTEVIMRTVRWQYLLRGTLRFVNLLAGSVGDGLSLLFGAAPARDQDGKS